MTMNPETSGSILLNTVSEDKITKTFHYLAAINYGALIGVDVGLPLSGIQIPYVFDGSTGADLILMARVPLLMVYAYAAYRGIEIGRPVLKFTKDAARDLIVTRRISENTKAEFSEITKTAMKDPLVRGSQRLVQRLTGSFRAAT